MTLGQNLQNLRNLKGFSQDDIAAMLSVSVQNVIQWEADETMPSIDILVKLSQIFGVSVDEILGNTQGNNFERPIAKAKIVTDKKEIYKIFNFKFLNSLSVLSSVIVLILVLLLASTLFKLYNKTPLTSVVDLIRVFIYPAVILIIDIILLVIKNSTKSTAGNVPEGNLLFYSNFSTIQHTDGSAHNIQYSSVKKVYELDYYLVLLFADRSLICIKKDKAEGYINYAISILRSQCRFKNYIVTRTGNKAKFSQGGLYAIKAIITWLTAFVIGSIYLSLVIWGFMAASSYLKDYNFVSTICCYLPALIPLAALIFGIVVCCKKVKSNRLIISSAIMLFFTLIYSSLFAMIPIILNSPMGNQSFEAVMKKQGLIVSNITTQRTENYLEKCYVAENKTGDYEIYCLEFDSSSSFGYTYALDFYNDKKEEFKEKHHVYYYDDSNENSYKSYYTGYDEDEYFVICQNDTTVTYACVDFEYGDEIKDIFSKLVPFHIPFYGI